MTKAAKTKATATKKCSKPRCSNDAASPRAELCTACFKKNAKSANLKRKVRGVACIEKSLVGFDPLQKKDFSSCLFEVPFTVFV